MSTVGSPRLTILADKIRADHAAAEADFQSGLQHVIDCGGGLIEAREALAHGEWLPWLNANFPLSERTAQIYMRFARNPKRVAGLRSIRQGLAALTPPPPAVILTPELDREITKEIEQGDVSHEEIAERLGHDRRAISDAVVRDQIRRGDYVVRQSFQVVEGSKPDDSRKVALPKPRTVVCPHCGQQHECPGYLKFDRPAP